jgi:hypothetical protein
MHGFLSLSCAAFGEQARFPPGWSLGEAQAQQLDLVQQEYWTELGIRE